MARRGGSTEVSRRDADGGYLGQLRRHRGGRLADGLLRSLAQAVAGANPRLVAASVAHAEGIVPVADAAQQVRQVDEVFGNEVGHAALALVAAADRHHAGREDQTALLLE